MTTLPSHGRLQREDQRSAYQRSCPVRGHDFLTSKGSVPLWQVLKKVIAGDVARSGVLSSRTRRTGRFSLLLNPNARKTMRRHQSGLIEYKAHGCANRDWQPSSIQERKRCYVSSLPVKKQTAQATHWQRPDGECCHAPLGTTLPTALCFRNCRHNIFKANGCPEGDWRPHCQVTHAQGRTH